MMNRKLTCLFFLVAACETPNFIPSQPSEISVEDQKVPNQSSSIDACTAPERVETPSETCPGGVLINNEYCIDKYEAPNQKGSLPFYAKGAHEAVSWCKAQGKELCTQTQWVTACKGSKRTPFPYGSVYVKGTCNDDKTWIGPVPWLQMGTPAWDETVKRLFQGEPSGNREKCKTPEGVYDLTGNVAEWVVEPRNLHGYVVKGCYWAGCLGGVPSCDFVNPAHAAEFKSYELGFRCCKKVVR